MRIFCTASAAAMVLGSVKPTARAIQGATRFIVDILWQILGGTLAHSPNGCQPEVTGRSAATRQDLGMVTRIQRNDISMDMLGCCFDRHKIANGRRLLIGALITVVLSAHPASALAAQAKPLIKVMAGYGSTDG